MLAASDRNGQARPYPRDRVDGFVIVLVAVVIAPLLLAAAYALIHFGGSYHASRGSALNEIVVRQIGDRLVLLGPYAEGSRSNPGPLFFYLMWIPYRVFGSNSSAMLIGTCMINAASVAGSIMLANRWGGRVYAVITAIGFCVIFVSLPNEFIWSPSGASVSLFAFGLFIFLMWAALNGDRFALPVGGVVGAFCVQTQLLYAGLVGGALLFTIVVITRNRRSPAADGEPIGLRSIVWLAVVTVAVWSPALLEQLLQSPGNLAENLTYLADGIASANLSDGFRVVANQFRWLPDWLVGLRDSKLVSSAQVPALLLPYFMALIVARFRGPSPRRNILHLLGVLLALAVLVVAQSDRRDFESMSWLWVIAALALSASAWTLWVEVAGRDRRWVVQAGSWTAAAVLLLLIGLRIPAVLATDPPGYQSTLVVERLARQIEREVSRDVGVVLTGATPEARADIPGLMLRMERAGYRLSVAATEPNRLRYGSLGLTQDRVPQELTIVADGNIEPSQLTMPGRQVALTTAFGRAERARTKRRITTLGRDTRRSETRADELTRLRNRLAGRAVFLSESAPPLDENRDRSRATRRTALFYGDGLGVEAGSFLVSEMARHRWDIEVRALGYLAPCDWLAGLAEDLRSQRPAVIGLLSAGDTGATDCMRDDRGSGIPMRSPAYYEKYRTALRAIFQTASQAGVRVVFFEPPPFLDPTREIAAYGVTNIAKSLAADYPGVSVSDAVRRSLSDLGKYTETLPCLAQERRDYRCGPSGRVTIRTRPGLLDSGLHLCPTGLPPNSTVICRVYSSGAYRYARSVSDALVDAARRTAGMTPGP